MKGYKTLGVMPARREENVGRGGKKQTHGFGFNNSREEKERLIERFLQKRSDESKVESTL